MGTEFSQQFSTTVDADVQTCFETLVDFERYPEWSSPITEARVLERYPDGLAKQVEFKINIKIKTIRYVLEYSYQPPRLLEWKSTGGDVKEIRGRYVLEPKGEDETEATCMQSVSLGFWLPGFLRSTFEQQALRQSVLEFKAGAEKRKGESLGKVGR